MGRWTPSRKFSWTHRARDLILTVDLKYGQISSFSLMLFLISYKFSDANAQEKGAKMLTEWYDKGGPQNRPDGYDVKSWIFLPQHGNGYSVVNADSLETIWRQWRPWRELMEITIEPCADLDETVALYR